MSLSFLTPLAGLVALAGVVPLVALRDSIGRGRCVRGRLGLPGPARRLRQLLPAAVVLGAVLLGLAATQPVVEQAGAETVRTDAEVFFVLDTSRSMLARRGPDGPTRLARARATAERVRELLPGIPVGIASLTDRVLPHLFPTSGRDVFTATLERAIGIEQPPPRSTLRTRVTTLQALVSPAAQNFFSPSAKHRLLVVFTDGESRPFRPEALRRALSRPPGIRVLFVSFWQRDERVYQGTSPDLDYLPEPASRARLEQTAAVLRARVVEEGRPAAVAEAARSLLGHGPTVRQGRRSGTVALTPYLVAAAALPLSFLLWSRRR